MIDPVNLRFEKYGGQGLVQFPGRSQIAAEGFFHNDAGSLPVFIQFSLAKLAGHAFHQSGRDRQVEDFVGLRSPVLLNLRQTLGQIFKGPVILEIGLAE